MVFEAKAEMSLDGIVATLRGLVKGEEPLPSERTLSQKLGVNRRVLRQGLRILRDTGEIEPAKVRATAGKSFRMLSILQNTSPVEVWEARLSMEPQIARAAALRATPREIEAIRDVHADAFPKVYDLDNDVEFHRRIAVASHNNLWIIFNDLLTELTREESFKMQLPAFTSVTGYEHHDAILAAIAERDGATAEKIMHTHLFAIQRWVMGASETRE